MENSLKCDRDDFIFWKGNVSNLSPFSALSTMSSPWPLKHPQQGFGGGSLFTLARVMTSGQLMMSSFCQRGKNTSSPWPIQLYHRSGNRLGSWSFGFYLHSEQQFNTAHYSAFCLHRTFTRSQHSTILWTKWVCGWCWVMKAWRGKAMTASVPQHLRPWCSDALMGIGLLSRGICHCVMATPFNLRYPCDK